VMLFNISANERTDLRDDSGRASRDAIVAGDVKRSSKDTNLFPFECL
jgi:hypothetical protein